MSGHNPVYNFLDISTNKPILSDKAEPEHIDAKDDLLAPFKVHRYSRRLWAALLAEFLGLAIFQIYGGTANDDVAALANGITLAVIVYATCNVSGGHLNPAVSFANCLTGHMSWSKGGVYVVAQVLGAIFGAFVESGLMPGVSPLDGSGPGCFSHLKGVQISRAQLFWWECIMTFVLVSVVYATAVTKPGHGSLAPLAIGFTLYASAAVGGPFTGAALNPARVLGPTLVFDCFWNTAFIYITGQLLGGFIAAVIVLPLYGFGQFGSVFDTRIFGWMGLQVPHRFHQLPEQEGYNISVSAQASPQARQFELSSIRPLETPRAPPTTAAAITRDEPKNRVFGNPQLGQVRDTAGQPGSPASVASSSSPNKTRSDPKMSEFLPDNWKVGTNRPY